MQKISLMTWLARLNKREPRDYYFDDEICYFPLTKEYKSLVEISDELNNKANFLNYKESFAERKFICNEDEEWKRFVSDLKKSCNYKCQLSGFGVFEAQKLSENIFGIPADCTWNNTWLTPHHTDGSIEYRCFDKDKLMILNRAIHMAYHRRYYIDAFIKRPEPDYALYFEIGSLIHDRNGIYPWRNITRKGEIVNAKNNCN